MVDVCPFPCQGHSSFQKANNKPKMLEKGDGVNAENLAACQEQHRVAPTACGSGQEASETSSPSPLETAASVLMGTGLLGAGLGCFCFAEPAQGSSYGQRCERRMS